jgi:hypothetical protein
VAHLSPSPCRYEEDLVSVDCRTGSDSCAHHGRAAEAQTAADREAVRQAALDYVEGVYNVQPERIRRSVHPSLAVAKVTASWGVDYMLLAKPDGRWQIQQILWQSPPPDPTSQ